MMVIGAQGQERSDVTLGIKPSSCMLNPVGMIVIKAQGEERSDITLGRAQGLKHPHKFHMHLSLIRSHHAFAIQSSRSRKVNLSKCILPKNISENSLRFLLVFD